MPATRQASAVFLLVSAVLLASTAGADELNPSVAEILFRDGQQLLTAGMTAQACLKFAESQRLDPQTGTLLNLALCHEKEGRTATAWAELAQVVTQAVRKGEPDREQFARSRGAELEKRLSRVTLEVDPGVATAGVDGQALGGAAWAVPLPLDPGEHSFAFSAPGKKTAVVRVVVPPGPALVRVHSPPLEADHSATASRSPLLSRGAAGRIGFATGGVGVAGIAVGAIFGALAIAKRDQVSAHCLGRECDAAGMSAQDSAHAYATVSTIGFAAGAVALGLGAYLVWTSNGPSAHADRTEEAVAAARASCADARSRSVMRLGPVATAGGAMLRLEGGW